MPILPILGSGGCKKRSRRFSKRRSESRSQTNGVSEDGSVTYLSNDISNYDEECSFYEHSDGEKSLEDKQSESDREGYSDEEGSYVSEQSNGQSDLSQVSSLSGRSL